MKTAGSYSLEIKGSVVRKIRNNAKGPLIEYLRRKCEEVRLSDANGDKSDAECWRGGG